MSPNKKLSLSLDTWAVTFAFILVLLVRSGILQRIPW